MNRTARLSDLVLGDPWDDTPPIVRDVWSETLHELQDAEWRVTASLCTMVADELDCHRALVREVLAEGIRLGVLQRDGALIRLDDSVQEAKR